MASAAEAAPPSNGFSENIEAEVYPDSAANPAVTAAIAEGRVPAVPANSARSFRGAWQRASSIGLVGVLLLALAFVLKDVLPREQLQWFTALIGFEKPESAEPASAGQRFAGDETNSFPVFFAADSDVMETGGWRELSNAIVALVDEPDLIALISSSSQDMQRPSPKPGLMQARIAMVKEILVDAGVSPHRVHVDGGMGPGSPSGDNSSLIEAAKQNDRAVHIEIRVR